MEDEGGFFDRIGHTSELERESGKVARAGGLCKTCPTREKGFLAFGCQNLVMARAYTVYLSM